MIKKLLYRILRKDMIRRLKVKHGEQFIEDVMQTFGLPFNWNEMRTIKAMPEWPKDPPESKNLPDCNHNRFCNQQTIFQTCKQEAGCNFKE